jgi:hypothetical protein
MKKVKNNMKKKASPKKENILLKSIWAVVAGFLAVFILSVVTDAILEGIGILPPPDQGLYDTNLLLLALAYRTFYGGVGGYITAKLAPKNAMKHVHILACMGLFFAILGYLGTRGMDLGPDWYPILLILFTYPSVWYGGKLQTDKK